MSRKPEVLIVDLYLVLLNAVLKLGSDAISGGEVNIWLRIRGNPALAEPDAARDFLGDQREPQKVRQRYDWLFEYDATTAPLALPMAGSLSFDVVNTPEAITQLAT